MLDDKKSHYIFVISRIFFQVTTTKKNYCVQQKYRNFVEDQLNQSVHMEG